MNWKLRAYALVIEMSFVLIFPICQTEPDDKVGQRTLCSVTTISPSVIQIRGFTGARSPPFAVCIMCHAHWIR